MISFGWIILAWNHPKYPALIVLWGPLSQALEWFGLVRVLLAKARKILEMEIPVWIKKCDGD